MGQGGRIVYLVKYSERKRRTIMKIKNLSKLLPEGTTVVVFNDEDSPFAFRAQSQSYHIAGCEDKVLKIIPKNESKVLVIREKKEN